IILPREGGKARLQGWGILENLTGGEWKDVELTLVSGNPVALKQQLYSAVLVDRPEIPVSASARFVPRKDDAEAQEKARDGAENLPRMKAAARGIVAPPPAAAPAPARPTGGGGWGYRADYAVAPRTAEELSSPALKAETEEAATQVLYRFP